MPAKPEISKGSRVVATSRSVVAMHRSIAAGRDVHIGKVQYQIRVQLAKHGPAAMHGMGNPASYWDTQLERTVPVEKLRVTLLDATKEQVKALRKKKGRFVSVLGALYPSGLLIAGWWDSQLENLGRIKWQDGIQEWLFHGFQAWGPSFDFSWDFEKELNDGSRPSYVAQLGAGDEANSIPVIIPADKAKQLRDDFRELGSEIKAKVAPLLVKVQGVLCHRSQCPQAAVLKKVGGTLDYCIWLKEGEPKHRIRVEEGGMPKMYSAYLWKCLASKAKLEQGKPLGINDAYFLWEHTNLANEDSIKYNVDSLEQKVEYLRARPGNSDLVVLQKSNILVPGEPQWSKDEFYSYFLNGLKN